MKSHIAIFSAFCTAIFLVNCGSTSKSADNRRNGEQLERIIDEGSYEIISDMALPMMTNGLNSLSNAGLFPPGSNAGQVNLIGNPNYVRVIGDSVSVYLPYYGERQMGGGYNNDGPGIQFDGIPTNMKVVENTDKQRYEISFQMKRTSEQFNVNMFIFPNLSTAINVNSNQRFPIRYQGRSAEFNPTEQKD